MILVIDNYDSFTYNLAQYLGSLGADVQVVRNDAVSVAEIGARSPTHIVISPGPGTPDDAGISLEVVARFAPSIPIIGVCLGHQAIGQAFGGRIVRANRLMHGKVSAIHHDGRGLFRGLPSPFTATRYHSLIVESVPDCLETCARTAEGEVMALRHRQYPCFGVQFHPESILTEHGHALLQNFLRVRASGDVTRALSATATLATPTPAEETTMPLREAITAVMAGRDLTEAEAESVMAQIMHGEATPAQIGALLAALRIKGETVPEIAGCARAMRNSAIAVHPSREDTIVDTCGTGGDGAGTFNISTTAAFVVAGAGQPVAKHGNRSVSSRCGSADVLEALGVNLELTPEQIATCVDQVGLGFLFAQRLHPAMKYAAGPRRELGVRTIFNVLGPLTNPAGVEAQVIGVYDPNLTEPLARVLAALGSKAAYVVHGAGGLDELTTAGANQVTVLHEGQVETQVLDPVMLGFRQTDPAELNGGTADENARITRSILAGGMNGAKADVVVLNAAAALVVGGRAETMSDGIDVAWGSLESGAALRVLDHLIDFTRSVAAA
jgi:anthranilate synthase/phosphoribosyltransferase